MVQIVILIPMDPIINDEPAMHDNKHYGVQEDHDDSCYPLPDSV